MAKALIVVFLATLAMAFADKVAFKDCGSKTGAIKSVDVTNCPTFPCTLTRGTSTNITMEFTSKTASTQVKAVVKGVIAGIPVPFPIPNPDGCTTGVQCPISEGGSYVYQNSLAVENSYPKLRLVVRWELHDEKDNQLTCFMIPVEIK